MPDPTILEKLRPESDVHQKILGYARRVKTFSEEAITARHSKWRELEEAYRAYIDLEEYALSRKKKAHPVADYPGAVPIVIPLAMASVHAALAFIMSVFGGSRPVIRISGRSPEDVEAARKAEAVLAYQFEHEKVRGLLKWFFWFQDALIYGSGFLGNFWNVFQEPRVTLGDGGLGRGGVRGFLASLIGRQASPTRAVRDSIVYEGNTFRVLAPEKVFPDPRVPLSDLQNGDFIGFSFRESTASLMKDPEYFNLEYLAKSGQITTQTSFESTLTAVDSNRQKIIGVPVVGDITEPASPTFPDCFELWARIIPRELDLSEETNPEVWVFCVANNRFIIRAEKSTYENNLFPVAALEFIPNGHQFLNQSFVEIIEGLQTHLSWLFNSHMESVRKVLNNTFVIDPSRIVMEDLEGDRIVKYVRLRPEYYGSDPKLAIAQLNNTDVTQQYVNDAMLILDIHQRLTSVTDMVFGLPAKGRRTALEMGGVQAAAGSRLKLIAEIFSLGGTIPHAKMMLFNTQLLMSQPIWARILGVEEGEFERIQVSPEDIIGEFDFPIADGTYPLDKYRMAEIWKELIVGVAGIPQLEQQIDLWKMFKQLGRTLGIKNIDDFRRAAPIVPGIQGNEEVARRAAAGNIVPIGGRGGEDLSDLARILGPLAGTPGRVAQEAA